MTKEGGNCETDRGNRAQLLTKTEIYNATVPHFPRFRVCTRQQVENPTVFASNVTNSNFEHHLPAVVL